MATRSPMVRVSGPVEAAVKLRPRYRRHRNFTRRNQARIGRGVIGDDEVRRRFAWLNDRLGGLFTDVRLCPHGDDDACACRKPRPGMFLDLAPQDAVLYEVSETMTVART